MGVFVHFSIIVEHPPWIYLGVGIIKLLIMVVIRLVLLMVMVEVVWILVTPTFIPKKLIFGLMVIVLRHLRVRIINQWVIQTKTGPLFYYIWKWSINLALLVMLEVLLVLGITTSPPRKLILEETGIVGC